MASLYACDAISTFYLRVMVPLSNLIMALAVVRNGVPRIKGLFSSSFISKITKSTGYTCAATSTNMSSAIPKRPPMLQGSTSIGVPKVSSTSSGSHTSREFLKKPEHFSHSVVDFLALLENGIFKPLHSFILMVVKGKVLNDFQRFVGIFIMDFAACGEVNLVLKMKGDMSIKNLDLKPTIDAMMRDFLEHVLSLFLPSRSNGVGSKRYHVVPYGELDGIPVAIVARFGVVFKSTDKILVSNCG
ncbi:hypothetical protein Tco_1169903 [Tanacetum coccineum]